MATDTHSIFIVWRAWQGRVEAMRPVFGFKIFYVGPSYKYRVLRPFEYVVKACRTARIVIREKPDIIWVQLPPTFLFHLLSLYRLVNRKLIIIGDCHNSVFRRPWTLLPLQHSFLSRYADALLSHNHFVQKEALALGFDPAKSIILETRPAEPIVTVADTLSRFNLKHPWALVPASYDEDEPVEMLLEAAAKLPDILFVLTGDTNRANGLHDLSGAPENVIFTGFLKGEEFRSLYVDADIIIGLTLYEGVQLSTANEAVGFGKAMVLSNTELLKELFPKGAVYVDPNVDSLIRGIQVALESCEELEQQSQQLRIERIKRWERQAQVLRDIVKFPDPK